MKTALPGEFDKLESYKPYPAYKDSGVEWLGEIPEHWDLLRLLYTIKDCQNGVWGDEPIGDIDVLVCIRVADFERKRNRIVLKEPTLRSVRPYQQKRLILKNGDLLLEKSGGGEQQPVGAVVLYDLNVRSVCSNFIARLEIKDDHYNPAYLSYLHKCLYEFGVNKRSIKQNTGIQNLDLKSYFSEIVGVPNIEDQAIIAKFLDRETAKIDALITKQERLIELLQEKRTALITNAVTKGLDPDAPMKDSGVEWLGEIPTHWDIYRLKRLALMVQTGSTPPTGIPQYYENGSIPWYGPANFSTDITLQGPVKYITESAITDNVARLYPTGSILISTIGTIGKVGYLDSPASSNQQITAVVVNKDKALAKLVAYYLKSIETLLQGTAPNTTLPIMNQHDTGRIEIFLPPLEEQKRIVTFIEDMIEKHDSLINKLRQIIGYLEEYRTALISAAVTGKIDVRGEVSCS